MAKIWQVKFQMPYNEEHADKIVAFAQHMSELTGKVFGELTKYSDVVALADEKQLLAIYLTYGQNDYNNVRITNVELALETPALDNPVDHLNAILDRVEQTASRVERMQESGDSYRNGNRLPSDTAAAGWNQLVGAPIPGAQLLMINRLLLKEDCCTDELQRHLGEGWRLLAVCPQESRRPDYVLGKYDAGYVAETADR